MVLTNTRLSLGSLNQSIEALELRCEELTKQVDELTQSLDAEKRKNFRLQKNTASESPALSCSTALSKVRHTSSVSEPETEEVTKIIAALEAKWLI